MNTQIYEEASDWIIKNREGDVDTQEKRRFDAWLRESPQHVRAYLEMSSIWEVVSSLDPSWNPNADELISRAHAGENVVPLGAHPSPRKRTRGGGEVLDPHPPAPRAPTSLLARRGVWFALAASTALATFGASFYSQRNTYSTDIGEQRSIVLNDGSTIDLNSRSRVRVRFTDAERNVDLLDGQALFHVAKNLARPFVVHSDSTRVRAVGTQFDVYRKRSGTIVTVVEGKVAVLSDPHPQALSTLEGESHATNDNPKVWLDFSQTRKVEGRAQREGEETRTSGQGEGPQTPLRVRGEGGPHPREGEVSRQGETSQGGSAAIYLTAGGQIIVQPGLVPVPKVANIAAVTAWTHRSLVFDSSPLAEVAEEFNRYNTRQLVIENPQLADFHVSGVFSSVDPTLLLRFLRTQPDLVVEETDREIRISRK